jgi:hypothetical protein
MKPIPPEQLRARRLALGALIAEGGCPAAWQFQRAGLPALVRASDLVVAANLVDACKASSSRRPEPMRPGPQF